MCTYTQTNTLNMCVHDESHQRLALIAIQKQWLSVHLLCAHHSNTVRCNIKNANKISPQFDSCNFLVCACVLLDVRVVAHFLCVRVRTALCDINMFMSYNIITARLDGTQTQTQVWAAAGWQITSVLELCSGQSHSMLIIILCLLLNRLPARLLCLMPHTNYERWWYLVQNAHRVRVFALDSSERSDGKWIWKKEWTGRGNEWTNGFNWCKKHHKITSRIVLSVPCWWIFSLSLSLYHLNAIPFVGFSFFLATFLKRTLLLCFTLLVRLHASVI